MKEDLYNSVYSEKAAAERDKLMEQLLMKYKVSAGTILEVGAGQGGNVAALRRFGFTDDRIFLNEVDEDRINHVKRTYPNIKLYEGSALELDFSGRFDCVFQSTVFTSILEPEQRRKLAGVMWKALKPGGIILWYDFVYDNPRNPNVKKVSASEMKSLFPGAVKTEVHRVTLAPPIGRRLAALYGLINLPFLRTHILAVIQKQS